MKSRVLDLLALSTVLSLCACSVDDGADTSAGSNSAAEDESESEGESESASATETSSNTADGDGGGDGDGDGDGGGDGDGDGGGDGDGDGGGDGDGDGEPDCGAGMSFSVDPGTNSFDAHLSVISNSLILHCDREVTFNVIGGSFRSTPDGAGGCYFTLESLSLSDIPTESCGGGTGSGDFGATDLVLNNVGDSMQVAVPSGGGMPIDTDATQDVSLSGTMTGTFQGPIDEDDTIVPAASVSFGANSLTATFVATGDTWGRGYLQDNGDTARFDLDDIVGSITLEL